MTKKEIEKAAENYAFDRYDIPFEEDSAMKVIVAEDAYEAGAHSRDKEVKDLKVKLKKANELLRTRKNIIRSLIDPWINVRDRLPEDNDLVLTIYWVHKDFYSIELSSYNPKTREWDCGEFGYRISHWMPIPRLPHEERDEE